MKRRIWEITPTSQPGNQLSSTCLGMCGYPMPPSNKREAYYVWKESAEQPGKGINVWVKPSSHNGAPSRSHQPVEENKEGSAVRCSVDKWCVDGANFATSQRSYDINTTLGQHLKEPRNLVTPFDFITTDLFQVSFVISTVTQDFDYVRFEEEASTDNIAVKSTWEFCQLQ